MMEMDGQEMDRARRRFEGEMLRVTPCGVLQAIAKEIRTGMAREAAATALERVIEEAAIGGWKVSKPLWTRFSKSTKVRSNQMEGTG